MPAPKDPTKGKKRVRCLGPIAPEHWFYSANLDGSNRICPRCDRKIHDTRLSPQCERPQKGGQELESER